MTFLSYASLQFPNTATFITSSVGFASFTTLAIVSVCVCVCVCVCVLGVGNQTHLNESNVMC